MSEQRANRRQPSKRGAERAVAAAKAMKRPGLDPETSTVPLARGYFALRASRPKIKLKGKE